MKHKFKISFLAPREERSCIDQAVDSEDLCLLVTCALKLSVIYS